MATTTVYASGDSGTVRANDATYLTAARGDGTFEVFASSVTGVVGQNPISDHYIFETFLKWDTSAVGTDVVSSVVFEVEGNTESTTTEFTIEGYEYDWGTTLESADFRDSDAGIPALGSIISSYDTSGGFDTTSGYNNDLNWTDTTAINGAGDTRIVFLSDRHRTETTPTTGEVVDFRATNATNDARLTITHAPSGPTLTYLAPDADVTTTGWSVV